MKFLVTDFFSLENFEHASLFDSSDTVWNALKRLKEYLKGLKLGNIHVGIPEGVTLVHKELISIGEGSVIEPGSYIQGPCVIGKNCQIRHGAYIRGDVLVGDESIIGHTTEVKHSIFLNKAYAAHFAYVGDSILGNHVNLGAGVKCANLRLDGSQIYVRVNEEKTATGLRKLGAIVGDNSQVGCNTVLNPGTLIGKDVCIHPTLAVQGFIPSSSRVYSEEKICVTPRK